MGAGVPLDVTVDGIPVGEGFSVSLEREPCEMIPTGEPRTYQVERARKFLMQEVGGTWEKVRELPPDAVICATDGDVTVFA